MTITESTIEATVMRIDAQTGPVGGYNVELAYTTPDTTTKMGGVGSDHRLNMWMLTTGTVALGDLVDIHIIAS